MTVIARLNRYHNGENRSEEVVLPSHVTITGEEDHFALACHDAKMILAGLRIADPAARWTIRSVDIG